MSNHGPNYDYHKHNLNGFVSFLQGKINDNFLVDENKYSNSKRNRLFNPWITNGIIASVQRKTYFYDQWKSPAGMIINLAMKNSILLYEI